MLIDNTVLYAKLKPVLCGGLSKQVSQWQSYPLFSCDITFHFSLFHMSACYYDVSQDEIGYRQYQAKPERSSGY